MTCEQDKSTELDQLLDTFVGDPLNGLVCYQIGVYFYRCGFYRDAVAWLKKTLQLNQANTDAETLLEKCNLALNTQQSPSSSEPVFPINITKKPLSILFIGDYFYPAIGGAEKSALAIMRTLRNCGHNCMALCLGEGKGTHIDGIAVRYIRYSGEIEPVIARVKPDLLLTQLVIAEIAISAAYKYHIPSVVFIRSFEYFCSSPLKLSFCTRNCDICESESEKKTDRTRYKKMLQHADVLISNSEFMRQLTLQMYGLDSLVIYPPVDLADHHVQTHQGEFILMSNPEPHKGGSLFYEICEKLPDYRFMTVGDGGYQKVSNCINYSQTDPLLFLSVTKILLVPSVWPEPFGRIALEAMLNGIVVIASNCGGLPELVGDAGVLIDDFTNSDAWVDALKSLWCDDIRYELLSKKSIERSRQFAFKYQMEKLESVFRSVITIDTQSSDQRIYNFFTSFHELKPVFTELFSEGRDRLALVCSMVNKGDFYIDIGCADGPFMELLHRKGVYGVGIDVSMSNITRGISTFPHLHFLHGFAEDLPFENSLFTIALMGDILDCVRDPLHVLKEALRVSQSIIGYVEIGAGHRGAINPFKNARQLIELFTKLDITVTYFDSHGVHLDEYTVGNINKGYLFFKVLGVQQEKLTVMSNETVDKSINTENRISGDLAVRQGRDPRDVLHYYSISTLAHGERVLDMQCGRGELLCFIAQSGKKVYGINRNCIDAQRISSYSMSQGLQPTANVMVGHPETTSFPDNFFDTVILTNFPGYIKSLRNSIKEALRVVRDNGRLIIDIPGGVALDPEQIRCFTKMSLYLEICQYCESVDWYETILSGRIVAVFNKTCLELLQSGSYRSRLTKFDQTSYPINEYKARVPGFNIVGPLSDNSETGTKIRNILTTVHDCGYCVSLQDTTKNSDLDFVNPFRTWKDPSGYEMVYAATLLCIELNELLQINTTTPKWFKTAGKYQVFIVDRDLSPAEKEAISPYCDRIVTSSSLLQEDISVKCTNKILEDIVCAAVDC